MNRSMDTWLSKMQTRSVDPTIPFDEADRVHQFSGTPGFTPRANDVVPSMPLCTPLERVVSRVRTLRMLKKEQVTNLEEAWNVHRNIFDLDRDRNIDVEELILVLDRCRLFEGGFSQGKVRDYFKSLHNGEGVNDITCREFKKTLEWVANMRGMDLEPVHKRVITLSKRLCDEKASVSRRLEAVFDNWCMRNPEHISAFEFGDLCRKLKLRLCMGDVFLFFSRVPGGVPGKGADYQGFINLIEEVGDLLKLEDVYETFAKAASFLDNDKALITRVKVRMRRAAATVMGANWMKFFKEIDLDGNTTLDWNEFLTMCHTKLHLKEKKSHLRILFETIDLNGSDTVSLQELIKFVASE